MAAKRSRISNPDQSNGTGVEIEVDLGGSRPQAMTIVNPESFMEGGYGTRAGQRYTDLYQFQFGAYGTTWLLVWEPDSLEEALEKAAEWLYEHAGGLLTQEEELQDLYKEAAEEQGFPWPLPPEYKKEWEKVHELATADLTYTESGYLASWEWYVNELQIKDPIYREAFEASFENQRDELDEDDEERARALLAGLEPRRKKNPKKKSKKLDWDWTWPVMGSRVPSNRHYDADAPLGPITGIRGLIMGRLHLFPTYDGWKVYWETTEPYMSKMEGEGYISIGRVKKAADGKRMAQAWYDASLKKFGQYDDPATAWPRGLRIQGVEVIDTLNDRQVKYYRADGNGSKEFQKALEQYGSLHHRYVVQGVDSEGRVLIDNQGGAGGEIREFRTR